MSPHPDPLTVYCAACNEAFLGRYGEARCPRCGMVAAQEPQSSLNTIQLSLDDLSITPAHSTHQDDLSHLIGTTLDRYQIKSLLGKGGMGWVFLAQHLQLNRPCALKILSPSLIRKDLDYLERFHTEGQAAASLNHTNVVTVHSIGQASGYHFLEMEFVPGQSLQKVIDKHPLLPPRTATVALGIANGLGAGHRLGIVHRDLKPDNVLLTHHGVPKIGDFGLAKRLHGKRVDEVPGTLAGTPHFMAPELFQGMPASPASDVYALGVSMFVMLTGQVPFHAENVAALSKAIQHEAPDNLRVLVPGIPLEVCECVAMMMEKSPSNRPENGVAAAELLKAVLGQLRDIDSLMMTAFKNDPHVEWKRVGKRFELQVTLRHGRKQNVFIETSQHDISERLLQIYSLCCPATPDYFREALRMNSAMPHGSIAVRDIDDQEYFVALNNYPLGTADAEEIRGSVLELANCADAIELQLTGEDRH
ncbi:MAG TPA: serine/threonine-protein kinase [Planctomicrobium sp.]|nr:serine/threonine-protein kinase [Planctomicrobium sp.]